MNSIYIAAAFKLGPYVDSMRPRIRAVGWTLLSSWAIPHIVTGTDDAAILDYHEVAACDVLAVLPDTEQFHASRGGKWVEMGIALGMGKTVICVDSDKRNIFTTLPQVIHVDHENG